MGIKNEYYRVNTGLVTRRALDNLSPYSINQEYNMHRTRKIEIEFIDQVEPQIQGSATVAPLRIRFDANRMHYKERAVEQAYKQIQKLIREMHMDPYYAEGDQLY